MFLKLRECIVLIVVSGVLAGGALLVREYHKPPVMPPAYPLIDQVEFLDDDETWYGLFPLPSVMPIPTPIVFEPLVDGFRTAAQFEEYIRMTEDVPEWDSYETFPTMIADPIRFKTPEPAKEKK